MTISYERYLKWIVIWALSLSGVYMYKPIPAQLCQECIPAQHCCVKTAVQPSKASQECNPTQHCCVRSVSLSSTVMSGVKPSPALLYQECKPALHNCVRSVSLPWTLLCQECSSTLLCQECKPAQHSCVRSATQPITAVSEVWHKTAQQCRECNPTQ